MSCSPNAFQHFEVVATRPQAGQDSAPDGITKLVEMRDDHGELCHWSILAKDRESISDIIQCYLSHYRMGIHKQRPYLLLFRGNPHVGSPFHYQAHPPKGVLSPLPDELGQG